MTQEEILEYNKRCAEFLGAIYSEHARAWGFGNAKNIGTKMFHGVIYHNVIQAERFEKELKFHSDWNWIMEVVDAIEKQGGAVCIGNSNVVMIIFYLTDAMGDSYSKTRQLIGETKKEAVVQAINQFLIWYNEIN